MILLRVYLFLGLVGHKVVWEVLRGWAGVKGPGGESGRTKGRANSQKIVRLAAVKAVKRAILAGILLQTMVADVLPILADATALRIVGTLLYSVGLLTAIVARIQLGNYWTDIEAARVLPDHCVVATGIYRFVRHPIYTGDLLLLTGLQLALNSWLVVAVIMLVPPVLFKAVREEQMLVQQLPGYANYCDQTKRFIPFLV